MQQKDTGRWSVKHFVILCTMNVVWYSVVQVVQPALLCWNSSFQGDETVKSHTFYLYYGMASTSEVNLPPPPRPTPSAPPTDWPLTMKLPSSNVNRSLRPLTFTQQSAIPSFNLLANGNFQNLNSRVVDRSVSKWLVGKCCHELTESKHWFLTGWKLTDSDTRWSGWRLNGRQNDNA